MAEEATAADLGDPAAAGDCKETRGKRTRGNETRGKETRGKETRGPLGTRFNLKNLSNN